MMLFKLEEKHSVQRDLLLSQEKFSLNPLTLSQTWGGIENITLKST